MAKLVVFILLMIYGSVFASEKLILPSNKRIEYVGRWDKTDPKNYHSYWGGAYFNLSFKGNAVKINLTSPVSVYVKLDDGKMVLYKNVSGWVKITPDTLHSITHHLQVIAKFQNDEIQLAALALNEGGKLLKSVKKKHWVEYIGDSITSGDRTTQGNTSAYPWLCSELLNVAHTQISYCGIPLVSGYHHNYKGAPEIGMESAYLNLKQPNHPDNTEWDFTNAAPDILIINLGTNDHNLQVDTVLFKQTITQFTRNLRFIYPNSHILVMVPFNQAYRKEITEMVLNEQKRDKKLQLINTENWLNSNDFVDGTHPTDAAHLKISARLVKIIKPLL
ncbi:hypothetical protein I5M32_11745 [Pedobacter sp. SD-b]|uniref:Carbohydrate esterase 2 N-terminal domain-containing protein n=1 Tax=Pedobacter segetis TaxID=2793069 RepID=A0ABS1BLL1_9SPHI|nr:SGNH/GDSL hydrolase family protein [Pedobacter segetis]MBK0383631.1 hypothetical protein [Pedobacter segetis]